MFDCLLSCTKTVYLKIVGMFSELLTFKIHTLFQEIHVRDNEGRVVIFTFVLNAIIGAVLMWNIVGRTKLCLDFR